MAATAVNNYLEKPGSYFFAVEAGADTTQLKDLQEQAGKLGYTVLKASPGAEYLFGKAFKDAKLDNYAKELQITQPAKLQRAFVITPAGKLASKSDAEGFQLEGDVFTSMLSAVGDFMEDALVQSGLKSEEPYKSFTQGNFTIEMVYNQNFTTAAIYEGSDSRVKEDLKKTHSEIDKNCGDMLCNWDGAVTEQIQSLENILKENLFDTQKYTGEYDIAALKQLREQRRWKTLNAIENLAKEKKVLLYLDNLGDLDPATIEDLYHIARNAKDKFTITGMYHTDNIKDEPENKDLQSIIDKLREEKLCETFEIRSQQSVYEILPNLSKNGEKLLQFAALGANGSALLKASGLSTTDFAKAYLELQGKRLLVDDRVVTRKLAAKIAEEVTDAQTYLAVAKAIEDVNKDQLKNFAGVLSDLYSKANKTDEAAKWAKTAAGNAIKNADLVNALRWYRTSAQLSADNKERIETLEKVVELGFYQLKGRESNNELEEDIKNLEQLALTEHDLKRQAVAKLMRTKVCISGSRLDEALEILESATSLFQESKDEALQSEANYCRGSIFLRKGNYNKAEDCFKSLLEQVRTSRDKRLEPKVLASMGVLLRGKAFTGPKENEIDTLKASIPYYEQALRIAKNRGDTNLEAKILELRAGIAPNLGMLKEAEEDINQAIKLSEEIGNVGLMPSLLTSASNMMIEKYKKSDDPKDLHIGLEYASHAIEYMKKIGDMRMKRAAIGNRREIYDRLSLSELKEFLRLPISKEVAPDVISTYESIHQECGELIEELKKRLEKDI